MAEDEKRKVHRVSRGDMARTFYPEYDFVTNPFPEDFFLKQSYESPEAPKALGFNFDDSLGAAAFLDRAVSYNLIVMKAEENVYKSFIDSTGKSIDKRFEITQRVINGYRKNGIDVRSIEEILQSISAS